MAIVLFAFTLFQCSNPVNSTVPDPTLSSIQAHIFDKSCTTSSCHSTAFRAGGMSLVSGQSYASLVSVLSENDAARNLKLLRVNPGKPDSSFLIVKLNGPGTDEGERMPNRSGVLSATQIEAIRQWIANGAKNN